MEEKTYTPPTISVLLQPEEKLITIPRPKTVLQLLKKLEIKPGTALVIRDGGLLTPDRHIFPEEHLTVRIVTSSG